jgi:microcin C transport system permease protein
MQFVEAARAFGVPATKIIMRHILPNALTPIVTFLPFSLIASISALSALDFLGYGLPPPTPSWGELIGQGREMISAWWLITFPSIALFITILLSAFVGEGLRDAFDPKARTVFE